MSFKLEPGGFAFIARPYNSAPVFGNKPHDEYYKIQIIGTHNGAISRTPSAMARNSVLMPYDALFLIRETRMTYLVFRFELDTGMNREIAEARTLLTEAVNSYAQRGFMEMEVVLHDEELRVVVGQMDPTLMLINALYPVVFSIAVLVAVGLGVLLTIQQAKNAAIMRVLGVYNSRIRVILCFEYILVVYPA